MSYFVGIDPSSREEVATHCACLREDGCVDHVVALYEDAAIVRWLRDLGEVLLVGVDGPLRLPGGESPERFFSPHSEGDRPRRSSEVELARRGIGCFFTVPRSFARTWVERSLRLGERLRQAGFSVIEVYPYGTRKVLWGGQVGRKQRREARLAELERLQRLGIRWEPCPIPSHHVMDAVLCALTAFLAWTRKTISLGNEEDGPIFLPDPAVDWPLFLPTLWRRR
ncbi:MAG: DUF429 domain-containing protein [candidate division KSB1 bacterium]|nr:DUF429 domain-containing protein [candidate division KSB1 bacterium]